MDLIYGLFCFLRQLQYYLAGLISKQKTKSTIWSNSVKELQS